MNFGLLHVQPGQEGGLGQDVRRLQHALAAQAGKTTLSDSEIGEGWLAVRIGAGLRHSRGHGRDTSCICLLA